MSEIGTPAVIVNFKAYPEAEGPGALELARACERVSRDTGVCIAACPPVVETSAVARAVSVPVLAQGADPKGPGSATGWATPSMVAAAGCAGTLVNHSEHRLPVGSIAEVVRLAHGCGLAVVACAESAEKAREIAALGPDFVAVEPPELIGGDVSVTTASPQVVSDTVEAVHSVDPGIPVLCGAGVKTGRDVAAALELGAAGVLLASGVVRAGDPEAVLRDLVAPIAKKG